MVGRFRFFEEIRSGFFAGEVVVSFPEIFFGHCPIKSTRIIAVYPNPVIIVPDEVQGVIRSKGIRAGVDDW